MNAFTKYLLASLSIALGAASLAQAASEKASSSTLGRDSMYFEALVNTGIHQKNELDGKDVGENRAVEAKYKALFGGRAEVGMAQDSFRVGLNFSYNRANGKEFDVATTTGTGDAATLTNDKAEAGKYRREFFSYMLAGYYDMPLSEDLDASVGVALGAATVRTGQVTTLDDLNTASGFTRTFFTWGLNAGLAWHATERVDLVARYDFQYVPGCELKGIDAKFNRTLLHSFGFGLRFHL